MPKEVVYGRYLPYSDEDPARSIVDVRWDRETGYFQIATRCVRSDTGGTYIPPDWQAWFDGSSSGEEGMPNVMFVQEGFFVDLDREGINRLIRNLRRARDQAFGRDE